MKKLLLSTIAFAFVLALQAQNPVKWTFTAKKIADKTYEVKISAVPQSPWHIYSQKTPEGGPMPTKITFTTNPVLKLEGAVKESGELKEKYEEVFDIKVKYFKGNVDFTQIVKLKSDVKTNILGTVEFMACDDEQCLTPTTIPFNISLQ